MYNNDVINLIKLLFILNVVFITTCSRYDKKPAEMPKESVVKNDKEKEEEEPGLIAPPPEYGNKIVKK